MNKTDEKKLLDSVNYGLSELKSKVNEDIQRAENLWNLYSHQNMIFITSKGTEVDGHDRGEELSRLNEFLKNEIPYVRNNINLISNKLSTSKELNEINDELDKLSLDYGDARCVLDDI